MAQNFQNSQKIHLFTKFDILGLVGKGIERWTTQAVGLSQGLSLLLDRIPMPVKQRHEPTKPRGVIEKITSIPPVHQEEFMSNLKDLVNDMDDQITTSKNELQLEEMASSYDLHRGLIKKFFCRHDKKQMTPHRVLSSTLTTHPLLPNLALLLIHIHYMSRHTIPHYPFSLLQVDLPPQLQQSRR
ncbi:hypothetical protein M5K25_024834 [Dendrobium thyrsiflorum]|uniref:Uncharacterized protein n=1 Tax=Dendrobium thyrsiflorum TaxID=117978 RepID=A0ABD0U361_DENTH